MKFLKEVKAELEKVEWPSKEKAMMYTLFVIVFSLFVSYYMFFFDYLFLKFIIGNILS